MATADGCRAPGPRHLRKHRGTAGASAKEYDYNHRYDYTLGQVDNPCTPEFDDITLAPEFHSVGKFWRNDDRSYWYQGSNRGHLSGSAADATGYIGGVQFRSQTRVDDGVADILTDAKHMLVSQGEAPNFTIATRCTSSSRSTDRGRRWRS